MKKIIILFVVILTSVISGYAKSTEEYVKYGNGLELIIKTETHWLTRDTKTYGLRKHGMEILKPSYEPEDVTIIEELSCIIFMSTDTQDVHVYDIATGQEVYVYRTPVNEHFFSTGYRIVKEKDKWLLVESRYDYSIAPKKYIIATFGKKDDQSYYHNTSPVLYKAK